MDDLPTVQAFARHRMAAIAATIPPGYKLVPVEPTEAMVDSFVACALQYSIHGEGGGWTRYARVQWGNMLSAAPTPEAVSQWRPIESAPEGPAMTETNLDELKAMLARAGTVPWRVVKYGDGDSLVIHDGRRGEGYRVCFMATPANDGDMRSIKANAALIVALRNTAPALIEELEHYRSESAEQARLLGMSAERELALSATVQQLRAENAELRAALEQGN